jgi:NAD(P)-dependent dehydrogenase (short-subunit alcohol dehydrogenase family)
MASPFDVLSGSRVVVVGGSSGIGLATAIAFADAGADVLVASRTQAKLDAAVAAATGRIRGAVLDAGVETNVAAFFAAQPPFQHLVLCANAGGSMGPLAGLDLGAMRTYLDSKLWSYLNTLKHAGKSLARGGSVTLVNGAASRLAVPGMAALAVVNGGLDAVIRPLALEMAPTRINVIAPGVIDTPYWDKLGEAQRRSMYEAASKVPVGRVGQSAEVAAAALMLAANGFITGVVLDVDGGRRLVP